MSALAAPRSSARRARAAGVAALAVVGAIVSVGQVWGAGAAGRPLPLLSGAAAAALLTVGNLALVLHAHLPYVHSSEPGSLEEDWYFQALLECYLPLLEVLEQASADPAQQPRLSMGLSPTLLSLSPEVSGAIEVGTLKIECLNCRTEYSKF